jgi:hypothetical protein
MQIRRSRISSVNAGLADLILAGFSWPANVPCRSTVIVAVPVAVMVIVVMPVVTATVITTVVVVASAGENATGGGQQDEGAKGK